MKQSPSWEGDSSSAGRKYPAFYGTWRSITVFTRGLRWTTVRTIWIQSTSSHVIYLRFILILPSHLLLDHSTGLFPSGYPNKILYAFIYTIRATYPAQLNLLDLISLIISGEKYNLWLHTEALPLCTTFSSLVDNYYRLHDLHNYSFRRQCAYAVNYWTNYEAPLMQLSPASCYFLTERFVIFLSTSRHADTIH
jgi:hypothetical protein